MIAGSLSRPRVTMASRVARTAASATTSIAAPVASARATALAHRAPQHGLEPVMAQMMQMVGLGRREQDAVDARPEQASK